MQKHVHQAEAARARHDFITMKRFVFEVGFLRLVEFVVGRVGQEVVTLDYVRFLDKQAVGVIE